MKEAVDGQGRDKKFGAYTVEPRFNEVPRDWANWFVISRILYIENLVITNLLENNQIVRYIGVQLIINRTNKRQRR